MADAVDLGVSTRHPAPAKRVRRGTLHGVFRNNSARASAQVHIAEHKRAAQIAVISCGYSRIQHDILMQAAQKQIEAAT